MDHFWAWSARRSGWITSTSSSRASDSTMARGSLFCGTTVCSSFALRPQITIIERAGKRIDEQVVAVRESQSHLAVQSGLLETTLEHMNHGLMMVDPLGVVAICNRRAIEMLDLPAAMMAARPHVTD